MVSGLPEVPNSGDILRVVADERDAREIAERYREEEASGRDRGGHATMEELYQRIQSGQGKEVRVILKSDVSGSLDAIVHQLEKLQSDEVRINILHASAGEITENDVLLASASDAIILGFTTTLTPGARRMAELNGNPAPTDMAMASYSIPFCAAVALARHAVPLAAPEACAFRQAHLHTDGAHGDVGVRDGKIAAVGVLATSCGDPSPGTTAGAAAP